MAKRGLRKSDWQRITPHGQQPYVAKKGLGVYTCHGVLGYGVVDAEGHVAFTPLVFENLGRAQGLARTMHNRTMVDHDVTPVFCEKAVGVGAFTRIPDSNDSAEVPADGRSSRFMQSQIHRKRRAEERKKIVAEFTGDKA